MIKTLGLIALVLVVGVFVAAAFRPDSFRVERRLRIQAPPATVYGLIQDLHQFNRWNPWPVSYTHLTLPTICSV